MKVYAGDGLFAGKYKMSVVKFQLVCTNQGMVSYLSGPHKGRESDTTLFRLFPPPLRGRAYLLGDKAYVSCPRVLPPIKNNNRRFNGAQRTKFNVRLGHWRSRVEQAISARFVPLLAQNCDYGLKNGRPSESGGAGEII